MNNNNTGSSAIPDYMRYARDIGFIALAQVIVSLLNFMQLPILTKWLGASLYGTWSLMWITVVLLAPLVTLGLGTAMVRFLAAEEDVNKIREGFVSVVLTILFAGILASLVIVFCSNAFAASVLGNIDKANSIKLTAFMITTQALSQISFAFFRTFRQMKIYSAFLAGKATIELAFMVCFLIAGWELIGVIIAVITSDIIFIVVASIITIRQIGFCLPRFAKLKSYLKYGLPLMPSGIILWIIQSSDRYIIGYFMEVEDVGIYTAAYTLANAIIFFLGPLQVVLLPMVSKSYDEGDVVKTRAYLKYSLKYLMTLSIPAAFGLSVLAYPLLRILTTIEFTAGSMVVPVLAFGILSYTLYQVCMHTLYLVKKTIWILSLLCISAGLNIGLNILLIPNLGILGAAVAALISYAVLGILTTVISFRYLKFDLDLFFLGKSVLASAIMAIIIKLINPVSTTQIIISILLGIITYYAIIFALKGFKKSELEFFNKMLRWPNQK